MFQNVLFESGLEDEAQRRDHHHDSLEAEQQLVARDGRTAGLMEWLQHRGDDPVERARLINVNSQVLVYEVQSMTLH